jgi:DNA invertase Pin-like site-specific DNA recombinase
MSFVSDLRRQAESRMKELEPAVREYEQLRRIVGSMQTGSESRAEQPTQPRAKAAARRVAGRRSTARKRTTRQDGRRVPGGSAQEVLALVHSRPGISVREVADTMGIGTTYLYRVLPRLEREGKVRKEGRGYHPVADRT